MEERRLVKYQAALNLAERLVFLCCTRLFLTAMAMARLLPTTTTSFLARVMAVYRRFRWSMT